MKASELADMLISLDADSAALSREGLVKKSDKIGEILFSPSDLVKNWIPLPLNIIENAYVINSQKEKSTEYLKVRIIFKNDDNSKKFIIEHTNLIYNPIVEENVQYPESARLEPLEMGPEANIEFNNIHNDEITDADNPTTTNDIGAAQQLDTAWKEIDNNPATSSISVSAYGTNLLVCQLHNNGRIFRYIGPPFTGWQELDNNPATQLLIVDTEGEIAQLIYQLHNNGRIFRYTGRPFTGWQELDNNPATVAITAAGRQLYQLHNNGRIFRYTGRPFTGWQELDNNPATVAITAAQHQLYQLHNNGRIFRYTGRPFTGWQELDNNPATVAITAAQHQLYQLHNNGRIFRYTGPPFTGWQELDNNPATVAITAFSEHVGYGLIGNWLYQLHNNGRIFRYTGQPFTGWQELDNNPATVEIRAASYRLYQRHNNGRIFYFDQRGVSFTTEI